MIGEEEVALKGGEKKPFILDNKKLNPREGVGNYMSKCPKESESEISDLNLFPLTAAPKIFPAQPWPLSALSGVLVHPKGDPTTFFPFCSYTGSSYPPLGLTLSLSRFLTCPSCSLIPPMGSYRVSKASLFPTPPCLMH